MPQRYDLQPYLKATRAEVIQLEGSRVLLSETIFYPEGGGQNADQGTLIWAGGTALVVGLEKVDGVVWHSLEGDIPALGLEVSLELDWNWRYRNMQRHTAEHMLAQAFLRLDERFKVQAVSMRNAECTIDLEGNPSETEAQRAAIVCMEAMYRGLNIVTLEVAESQLEGYPVRRPPKVSGLIRLVLMQDSSDPTGYWEASACGGTHLHSTCEAAPLLILRLERIKSGLTRVVFSAGWEAWELLNGVYGDAKQLALGFSSSLAQLPTRVESLKSEHLELKKKHAAALLELADFYTLAAPKHDLPGGQCLVIPLTDPEMLIPIGKAMSKLEGILGIAYVSERILVSSTLEMYPAQQVLKEMTAQAQGKGGGKADLAQGSGKADLLEGAIWGVLEGKRVRE